MARRTQKQIEQDYREIREAAKTAESFKDLEKMTGLSYSMIITTLEKHPIVFKRLKAQLNINREIDRKTEETTVENFHEFVIDASISGIKDLKQIFDEICHKKAKLVLTSVTIRELDQMQKFQDVDGHAARYILAMAAENNDCFKTVQIDESLPIADDCIIKYCVDNKERTTLLTADKTMALKARMYGVNTQYFKHKKNTNTTSTHANNSKTLTLIPAKRVGNQLVLPKFHTQNMSIRVYSNGFEYNEGPRNLKVGDDVYIITQKTTYITFAHYKMCSLKSANNCTLMFSRRVYDYSSNLTDIKNKSYRSFLMDFAKRHDLL